MQFERIAFAKNYSSRISKNMHVNVLVVLAMSRMKDVGPAGTPLMVLNTDHHGLTPTLSKCLVSAPSKWRAHLKVTPSSSNCLLPLS